MSGALRERIAALVGPQAILTGTAAARYRVLGADPAAVVAPESADQAAALLAEASREGWAVEPAGAGTALDAGRPPARLDLVLSTARLTGVREYVPADLTIGVGAGTSLDALDERLARERQWLPLDPPAIAGASLGAAFAAGEAGPLGPRLGGPRDAALGLQLVTGDGRLLDLGGRVVKNVAGYDLVRLAVGSHGTLGLITRLHLRLRPRPMADATVAASAGAPEPLLAAARIADAAGAAAVELLSPTLAAELGAGPGWLLLARFLGGADSVADAVARTRSSVAAEGCNLLSDHDSATAWPRLRALEAAATLRIRLSDLPSRLHETLAVAGRLVAGAGRLADDKRRSDNDMTGSWGIAAQVAGGAVRAWTTVPGDPAALGGAIAAAREEVAVAGGRVSVARAPAGLAERVDLHGEPDGLALMRALKRVFDPAGVLSPGRWVV